MSGSVGVGTGAAAASRVPTGSWLRCSRWSAAATSAIDHRVSGSGSSIRSSGPVRKPARSGDAGGPEAIEVSIAIALRFSGNGGCPSTAVNRAAPSAHTSSGGEGSAPRASCGEK